MGDDIGKWVDQARRGTEQHERAASRKRAQRAARKAQRRDASPRPETPSDDERIEVYRVLYPSLGFEVSKILFPGLLVGGATLVVLHLLLDISWIAAPVLLGLLLVGVVVRIATLRRPSFEAFRRWRRDLPFELVGWPDLVDAPHLSDEEYWRFDCRIAITLDASAGDDAKQAVDAVLFLFCEQANGHDFYALRKDMGGSAGNRRRRWHRTDAGVGVAGSVNLGVTRDIYHVLLERLVVVAREQRSITTVEIEIDLEEERLDHAKDDLLDDRFPD